MTQKEPVGPLTEGHIPLPEGKVFYMSQGEGSPVILLHMMGGGAWMWERLVPLLAKWFRVYALDWPGYYNSDQPARPYYIQDFTATLVQFMDSLHIPKADIVGTQGGAVTGMDLAITHPNRIRKLVMDNCPSWNLERARDFYHNIWRAKLCDERGLPLPMTVEGSRGSFMINPDQRTIDRMNIPIFERGAWYDKCHETMAEYDIPSRLSKVQTPTLIVYGEKDMRSKERILIEGIKDAHLEIVPEAGATPYYEQPERYSRLLMDFLGNP